MPHGRLPTPPGPLNRRRSQLLLLTLFVSAGCTGLLGGDSLSFSADPVTVSDAAVADSGFSVSADRSFSFERTIEVAGQSPTVAVNAHMLHLQRGSEAATPAQLVVLSAPNPEVLGQQVNLAERLGPMTLVDQAGASVGELERDQKLREHHAAVLGDTRTVEVFSGTATVEGQEADVLILSMTFSHEGDSITAIGIAPRSADGAEDRVLRAIDGIVRP